MGKNIAGTKFITLTLVTPKRLVPIATTKSEPTAINQYHSWQGEA